MDFLRRFSGGIIETFTTPEILEDTTDQLDSEENEEKNFLDDVQEMRNRSCSVDSGFFEGSDIATDEVDEVFICLDEVIPHNSPEDAWIIVYDNVYDITNYIEDGIHPGGEEVLLDYLGYDATMAFRSVGHSKAALKVLDRYKIGSLPASERLNFKH